MNGDNVGRIEGENRDLGSDREGFRNDLDIDNNPDMGDYAQEYDESGEQIEVNSPQERDVSDNEKDDGLEERREKRKKTYRRVVNGVVLGGMLSQAGGSAAPMANAQREGEKKEDNTAPVREQYYEDITMESTEDNQEFTFLDPSIGSGLDSEGLAKESVETEVRDVAQEIKDIIDITKWEGYKLESVEEIEPIYYVPSTEAYEKRLGTPLYVIPLHEDGQVNEDLPVLKYFFAPGMFGSFEVGEKYTVTTPGGDELIFGGPKDFAEKKFGGEFMVLISVKNAEGKGVEFASLEEGSERDWSQQGAAYGFHAGFPLDVSAWEEKLLFYKGVERTEIKNCEELIEIYDPFFYGVGEDYNLAEVNNFVDLFNPSGVGRIMSEGYINNNAVLSQILDISKHINSLDLNPPKLDLLEPNSYRAWIRETDPRIFIDYLATEFPDLDIPLGAYGSMMEKRQIDGVEDTAYQHVYGFYREIVGKIQGKNFTGKWVIDIKHSELNTSESGLGLFHSYIEQDSQVELYAGKFQPKDFKIGDIVLIGGEEEFMAGNIEYLVIVGREEKGNGEVVLAGAQADRYGQRRISILGIDMENINDILRTGKGENLYFIRDHQPRQ